MIGLTPSAEKPFAQKKKWARTHRTRPPRFEQAVNYTERKLGKQVAVFGCSARHFRGVCARIPA